MQEFIYCFQITKAIVFNVGYFTQDEKNGPHFVTSAMRFMRTMNECGRAGQCQEEVLPCDSKALAFYKKWRQMQNRSLTQEEYHMAMEDIGVLEDCYNYLLNARGCFANTGENNQRFSRNTVRVLLDTPLKKGAA